MLVGSIALLAGCKKKEDEEAKPPSKTELLAGTTSKNWRLTAAAGSLLGLTVDAFTPNPYFTFPDCLRDNIYTFNSNKAYQVGEGATACSPAFSDSGTWAFNATETQLTFTSNDPARASFFSGMPITIIKLDNTTLQGTIPVDIDSGVFRAEDVPVTLTFTAQ